MHAYLVTGNSTEIRNEKVAELLEKHGVAPSRTLNFTESPSIGIETVREITRLAVHTASGLPQAVVVDDADNLTPVAQNAFLKTLEEPPPNTIVILSARNEYALLPTIHSRCLTISSQSPLPPQEHKEQEELFNKLRGAGVGEKIKFAEDTGKSREDAMNFVEGQSTFLHHQIQDTSKVGLKNTSGVSFGSSEVNTRRGKALLLALQDLHHNVNPKMVLFELLKGY